MQSCCRGVASGGKTSGSSGAAGSAMWGEALQAQCELLLAQGQITQALTAVRHLRQWTLTKGYAQAQVRVVTLYSGWSASSCCH